MITELISKVFTTSRQAHLAHWKTSSYAKHMALGDFYDGVLEPLDDLVEDYQAAFGKVDEVCVKEFCTPSSDDDILSTLKEDIKWINKSRDKICKNITALENILDGISDIYLKTIYKLENLS